MVDKSGLMTVPEERTGPGNHQQKSSHQTTDKENGVGAIYGYIQVYSIGQHLEMLRLRNLDVFKKCKKQNLLCEI